MPFLDHFVCTVLRHSWASLGTRYCLHAVWRQDTSSARTQRDLQDADSAGAAEFDLNFEVAQAEAQNESGAGSTSMGATVTMAAVAVVAALL